MEFNEKLQELRKQKGMTQEELANALFVSRTAISKWESDRGYPNIDSLKAIARFFDITIDELLSGDELLTIAQEDNKQKVRHFCDLIFGLLDISVAMFLFLPFFGQKSSGVVESVSLLSLTKVAPYLKTGYLAVVISLVVMGVLTLAMQNCEQAYWLRYKSKLSLSLNLIGAILFVISLQAYAATFLLVILLIKVSVFVKKQ